MMCHDVLYKIRNEDNFPIHFICTRASYKYTTCCKKMYDNSDFDLSGIQKYDFYQNICVYFSNFGIFAIT